MHRARYVMFPHWGIRLLLINFLWHRGGVSDAEYKTRGSSRVTVKSNWKCELRMCGWYVASITLREFFFFFFFKALFKYFGQVCASVFYKVLQ